jgi:hypothetical protein
VVTGTIGFWVEVGKRFRASEVIGKEEVVGGMGAMGGEEVAMVDSALGFRAARWL